MIMKLGFLVHFLVDSIFHVVLLLANDSTRANQTMAHVSSYIVPRASHKGALNTRREWW
jgi:hypothetical protein